MVLPQSIENASLPRARKSVQKAADKGKLFPLFKKIQNHKRRVEILIPLFNGSPPGRNQKFVQDKRGGMRCGYRNVFKRQLNRFAEGDVHKSKRLRIDTEPGQVLHIFSSPPAFGHKEFDQKFRMLQKHHTRPAPKSGNKAQVL